MGSRSKRRERELLRQSHFATRLIEIGVPAELAARTAADRGMRDRIQASGHWHDGSKPAPFQNPYQVIGPASLAPGVGEPDLAPVAAKTFVRMEIARAIEATETQR
ncbi:MAG TPA: hypothetical protein VGG49_13125 [Steroidobacteraceae bacterium]|jgi:hypothetical protein